MRRARRGSGSEFRREATRARYVGRQPARPACGVADFAACPPRTRRSAGLACLPLLGWAARLRAARFLVPAKPLATRLPPRPLGLSAGAAHPPGDLQPA